MQWKFNKTALYNYRFKVIISYTLVSILKKIFVAADKNDSLKKEIFSLSNYYIQTGF